MWKHLKTKHLPKYNELKQESGPESQIAGTGQRLVEDPQQDASEPDLLLESQASCSSTDSQMVAVAVLASRGEGSSPMTPSPSASSSTSRPAKRKLLGTPTRPTATVPAMFDKMSNFKSGDKRASRITRLIANMICKDHQPLSVVEDKGFKRLIHHLEPRYSMPGRKHFSKKVIPEMYEEEKLRVKELLEQAKFVGFTTDMWTSTSVDDYLSLTAHFVDEGFQYHHVCLECIPFPEVSHTASAIATFLGDTLREWNLSEKVVCIMMDNGANVVSAIGSAGFSRLPCLAHTFQLVLKDGLLGKRDITEILAACRGVVGHYKHSSKAMKVLRATQARIGVATHRLVQDEPTRWNSQLHMLARLVEQKEAVLISASELNFPIDITARQWTKMAALVKIMDVFDRATFAASSSTVTISEVIPIVNSTIRALSSFKSAVPGIQSFCTDLITSLKRRYSSVETEELYTVATLLDPRIKGTVFTKKEHLDQAKAALVRLLSETSSSGGGEGGSGEQPPPPEETSSGQEGNHSMWSLYSELMQSSPVEAPFSPAEEVNAYLAEKLIPPGADMFNYWKENLKYPNLRQLSKKYLVTPPSTVISERLFSTSGIIVDRKRSRLDPERVRMLVFLNKNLQ